MSVVAKNRRFGPSRAAHARTAAAVGGVRSEEPISRCSAGQRSAPRPVPRWSIVTTRTPGKSAATRGRIGIADSPGPPLRNTTAGPRRGPVCATRSRSVPGISAAGVQRHPQHGAPQRPAAVRPGQPRQRRGHRRRGRLGRCRRRGGRRRRAVMAAAPGEREARRGGRRHTLTGAHRPTVALPRRTARHASRSARFVSRARPADTLGPWPRTRWRPGSPPAWTGCRGAAGTGSWWWASGPCGSSTGSR